MTEVLCFKCREKGHYAYECPQGGNKNGKEEATEIALPISKVPSEDGTTENATCVECETQETVCYSEVHCEEDQRGGIEVQRRTYVKFYARDDEDEEEFDH
jgi:hypothetical protein